MQGSRPVLKVLKDYSNSGSMLESTYFGKLPCGKYIERMHGVSVVRAHVLVCFFAKTGATPAEIVFLLWGTYSSAVGYRLRGASPKQM